MPVELSHVSYSYGASAYSPDEAGGFALADVSVRIEDGEFVGIMGRTGCGKSTLMLMVDGLLRPTEGKVLLDGEDINDPRYDRRLLRQAVGIVFQYPEMQLFEQSVRADVAFGCRQMGLSPEECEERANWALELMGFDASAVGGKHPLGLSGGERRRVAIAGVLAARPRVLILDEPIAGLDPGGRRSLMGLLQELNREGATILMVSHNADCLAEHARRIIVLRAGKVELDAAVESAFADVDRLRELGVGVGSARALASALEKSGVLAAAGQRAAATTYADLLDAIQARFGGERR